MDMKRSFAILALFAASLPSLASETITINLPNLPSGAKPLEMVLIPAGTFTMGSPNNEQDVWNKAVPQHQVMLTKSFYMGKYEVTEAQWQAVMGSNPEYWNDRAVKEISWNECQTFIQNLNQLGQRTFRLPTEAEWEYACRAGTITEFYWGNDVWYTQIGEYAWYYGNSSSFTREVGLKKPNAWGLYDMSGNVLEWCQDWYGNYSSDAQIDPTGPNSGSARVRRSGSWNSNPSDMRSASRTNEEPHCQCIATGFRIVTFEQTITPTQISTNTPNFTHTPNQMPTFTSSPTNTIPPLPTYTLINTSTPIFTPTYTHTPTFTPVPTSPPSSVQPSIISAPVPITSSKTRARLRLPCCLATLTRSPFR